MTEFDNPYYDGLLDDPVEDPQDVVDSESDTDNEPLIPDQESDDNESDTGTGDGDESDNGNQDNADDDVITSYLKSFGIKDPTKIVFETEDGETEEKD